MKLFLKKTFQKKLSFIHFGLWIFFIKVIFVCFIGFHYEQDSPRYLLNIRHLYNPPLYSLVLRLITKIYLNLYAVIIFQTFIFSVIITIFSFRQKQNHILWAIFWALEPFSTFYCSNLMSEWLFIALLFACYVQWKILHLYYNYQNLTFFIFYIFLLYMTRYVGFTFFIFFLLYEIFILIQQKNFEKFKYIIFSLLLFFILSFPIRIIHYLTFKTFTVNAYDGLNLWNSISVLYPGSNVQKNPQNNFEKFLKNYPDSVFSTFNALMTHQMWKDSLPALHYANINHLSPAELNAILKETSYRLLKEESVITYFQKFVIPNVLKPFELKRESIGIQVTYKYIQNVFGNHILPDFEYQYEGILLLILILIVNFLLKNLHFLNLYLIFYWLSIIITSAIFMRYLYAIIPLALYACMEIIVNKSSLKLSNE